MTAALRRHPVEAAMALAAVVAAAVLALVVFGGDRGAGERPLLPFGRPIVGRATLTPPAHLFGDTVVARIEVVADKRRFDVDDLRLDAGFAPYAAVGRLRTQRSDSGHLAYIRYTQKLRCLTGDCIPSKLASAAGPNEPGRGDRRTFEFPPARILAGRRPALRVRLPALESMSRINAAQHATLEFPFRSTLTPVPAPSYALAPRLLALISLAGALALLAVPGRLAYRRIQRWRAAAAPPRLSPLERALVLVEAAAADGNGHRREALERLAAELERARAGELADEARALAWARPLPPVDEAGALTQRVRATVVEGDGRPA